MVSAVHNKHKKYNIHAKEADANKFKNIDCCFKENLPEPDPCKNRQKVITYFKTGTSKDMLKMLQPVLGLLDKYNTLMILFIQTLLGK